MSELVEEIAVVNWKVVVCVWAAAASAEGVAVVVETVAVEANDGVAAILSTTVLVAAGVSIILTRLAEVIGVIPVIVWTILEVFSTLTVVSVAVVLIVAAMAVVIVSLTAGVVGAVKIATAEFVNGFRNFETLSEAVFVVNEAVGKDIGKDFVAVVVVIGVVGAVIVLLGNILVLGVSTAVAVWTIKLDVGVAALLSSFPLVVVRKGDVPSWAVVVAVWATVIVFGTTAEVVGAVLLSAIVGPVAAVVFVFVKVEVAVAATRVVLG